MRWLIVKQILWCAWALVSTMLLLIAAYLLRHADALGALLWAVCGAISLVGAWMVLSDSDF